MAKEEKETNMNTKNRRAVSPVIATVILVAVAITITIAVAYWMGGIAGGYTKFEKVEISTISCSPKDTTNSIWNITSRLKNTGSATATLNSAFINNYEIVLSKPISEWANTPTTQIWSNMNSSQTLEPGQNVTVRIWIKQGFASFSSGTTLNVKYHSAGGMDYLKVVELV